MSRQPESKIPEMLRKGSPRIQREFLAWYRQNRGRFALPLCQLARNRETLHLGFVGITSAISARLGYGSLAVGTELNGCYCDTIADFDTAMEHTPNGYVCKLCDPGERKCFRTRGDIWRNHLFEPFLAWVNEELANACWLRLTTLRDGGSSWAKLIHTDSELSEPDRTLVLISGLRRLDGQPIHDGIPGDTLTRLIPLRIETDQPPVSS